VPVGNNRLVGVLEELLDLVGDGAGEVAVESPGTGPGFWAGGPSAIFTDGAFWLAYRLRRPVDQGRGYANVVARSEDGVRFKTVATSPGSSSGPPRWNARHSCEPATAAGGSM
jgi:hypothetical protein